MFLFNGRSNRKEYVTFFLFEMLIILPYYFWLFKNYTEAPNIIGILVLMLGFIIIITYLFAHTSLTVRRLHDCNLNGLWCILYFILAPLGPSAFLVFLFIKGTPGPNRYGDPPD